MDSTLFVVLSLAAILLLSLMLFLALFEPGLKYSIARLPEASLGTPYFVPDRSAREELVRAIRDRGVAVRILTPGRHSDQFLTRRSSRRLYGDLLEAGAEIREYRPAMIHVKSLVVDELWSVVGSTNFDNRSFGLNDEVNLAACDATLARRLLEDFARDLAHSRAVSYQDWRRRPLTERSQELVGWLLERQQ